MDRRARKRLARREEILSAAMQIVLEDGLSGLTIARLAQSLDAAVGAIYRYFAGKDALLAGLQVRAVGALDSLLTELQRSTEARIEAAQAPKRQAALTRILVLPLGYLLHARQEPGRHHLIDAVLSAPAPLLSHEQALAVEEALSPLLARCAAAIEAAVSAGALRPGPALPRTHTLWAAVHGLEHFPKRDRLVPPELRSAALARILLGGLLVGWGARQDDTQAALELAVAPA